LRWYKKGGDAIRLNDVSHWMRLYNERTIRNTYTNWSTNHITTADKRKLLKYLYIAFTLK